MSRATTWRDGHREGRTNSFSISRWRPSRCRPITLTIGWREANRRPVIIPTTILLTLFASWLMGYTINRVSLFALIFSIGIRRRHRRRRKHRPPLEHARRRRLVETAVEAVAEVGNPTIVATLTIVAALLPMMFVSDDGTYADPIPANASMAMFPFFVAVTITPWLFLKIAPAFRGERRRAGARSRRSRRHGAGLCAHGQLAAGRPQAIRVFPVRRRRPDARLDGPVLHEERSREAAALRQQVGSAGRAGPAARRVPRTDGRALNAAAERLKDLPELVSIQASCRNVGAVQFQRPRSPLLHAFDARGRRSFDQPPAEGERKRASHEIALDIRRRQADLPLPPRPAH